MNETFKKIVDGLRYNTETSTKICTYESDVGPSDFKFEKTALFRTPRGRFFLAGFGGALSRWSERYENNGSIGGEGLTPIETEAARSFAELHADADTVAEYFEFEDA